MSCLTSANANTISCIAQEGDSLSVGDVCSDRLMPFVPGFPAFFDLLISFADII